jgi:hypothetical protein
MKAFGGKDLACGIQDFRAAKLDDHLFFALSHHRHAIDPALKLYD